ncbi:hypothetical protein Tco_1278506, partial [Tanacetum coccineum]
MDESLSKFMIDLAKRHGENSKLMKEIQASTDAAIRNQGASIKTLEIQIQKISKVLQERGFGSLPSSTEKTPRDHVKSILTTVETSDEDIIFYLGMLLLSNLRFGWALANLRLPEDVKVPLILGRPFLSTAHAKIDVFKRKITLRVGDEKIIFKSVKHASSLIKRVYMLSLRERMELNLEARLMGETLVFNRSLDIFYGDYVELNDLNVPLELRRDQVDDLMPTIKEGEDKVEYKGKNVVGAFMNVPIFVKKNSVVTHFAVVENMDGYRDQDMGDVIFREPFCKASCVEARRFDGLITIYIGNDNVTYQMARSHLRIPEIGFCMVFLYIAHDLAGKEIDNVGK